MFGCASSDMCKPYMCMKYACNKCAFVVPMFYLCNGAIMCSIHHNHMCSSPGGVYCCCCKHMHAHTHARTHNVVFDQPRGEQVEGLAVNQALLAAEEANVAALQEEQRSKQGVAEAADGPQLSGIDTQLHELRDTITALRQVRRQECFGWNSWRTCCCFCCCCCACRSTRVVV